MRLYGELSEAEQKRAFAVAQERLLRAIVAEQNVQVNLGGSECLSIKRIPHDPPLRFTFLCLIFHAVSNGTHKS